MSATIIAGHGVHLPKDLLSDSIFLMFSSALLFQHEYFLSMKIVALK